MKRNNRPELANSICEMAGINRVRQGRRNTQYFTRSELLQLHAFISNLVRANQNLTTK